MPAVTDKTEDADIIPDRVPLDEINDPAPIISMDVAVSF